MVLLLLLFPFFFMRLRFQLSANTRDVPFSYQHTIIRNFHRLFPKNDFHDDLSLYSFSWLHTQQQNRTATGFHFPNGAEWFVSFYDEKYIRSMLATLLQQSELFFGMRVLDATIQETPVFPEEMRFFSASPILAKQFDGTRVHHRIFSDHEADAVLTQTLRTKLRKAGLNDSATVRFDRSFGGAKTRLVDIGGIRNRASSCPVIVEGSPEAVAFVWNVGVGHSTGAGFGAVREFM
jgi:CRISPR-associated endoribonuclease Cas6